MHACPICQEPCSCDFVDVWTEPPVDCQHECAEEDALAFLRGVFSDDY